MNLSFHFNQLWVLWTLPLAFLPVLFHFLFRRPPKIVPFGDIRFLKKIFERTQPRRKLRQWLILICRVLALLFLILFFSRPVFHIGRPSAAGDSIALAVLADVSYSMRYQESGLSQWDRALRLAGTAFAAMSESDRSSLALFSDRIEQAPEGLSNSHKDLAEKISGRKAGHGGTNVFPALQSAYQSLSNSGASNKAVLILSDMARHGWFPSGKNENGNWEETLKNYDPAVRLLYSKLPPQRRNVSLRDLRVYPDVYSGFNKVEVRLKNWGLDPERGVPVFLDAAETGGAQGALYRRQSETLLDLRPLEEKKVVLTAPLSESALFAGRAGIRNDALDADDVFYFVQPALKKIRVLCVEDQLGIAALSGESYYLRQALSAPPTPFEVKTVTLADIKGGLSGPYNAVVLVNPGEIGEETAGVLDRFVRSGGSLLFTAGERFFNANREALAPLLPCGLSEIAAVENQGLGLVNADRNPDFQAFSEGYDWDKVRVTRVIRPEMKENAEAWLALADGTPFLVADSGRRVAVWLSSVDRQWNNLPSKPVYAPLLRLVLSRLGSGSEGGALSSLRVGDVYRKKNPGGTSEKVKISGPAGESIEQRTLPGEIISAPLESPGLYRVETAGGKPEWFAVNVNAAGEEGDGTAVSEEELRNLFPRATMVAMPHGDNFRQDLLIALRGKELTRSFLILACLFLLAELFLLKKVKR